MSEGYIPTSIADSQTHPEYHTICSAKTVGGGEQIFKIDVLDAEMLLSQPFHTADLQTKSYVHSWIVLEIMPFIVKSCNGKKLTKKYRISSLCVCIQN